MMSNLCRCPQLCRITLQQLNLIRASESKTLSKNCCVGREAIQPKQRLLLPWGRTQIIHTNTHTHNFPSNSSVHIVRPEWFMTYKNKKSSSTPRQCKTIEDSNVRHLHRDWPATSPDTKTHLTSSDVWQNSSGSDMKIEINCQYPGVQQIHPRKRADVNMTKGARRFQKTKRGGKPGV